MMPPATAPQLDPEERGKLISWAESELQAAAAASLDPGRTEPRHRLNRAEYAGCRPRLIPPESVGWGMRGLSASRLGAFAASRL